MQPNSIPEPLRSANERDKPAFPTSGDNFDTITSMEPDALALQEAILWLEDYQTALAVFKAQHCTGTVGATDQGNVKTWAAND